MSKVSTILLDHAKALSETEESVAVDLLKQAGLTEEDARFEVAQALMEKEAYSALVNKGVDYDEAVRLVKAANVNVRDLGSFSVITEEKSDTVAVLEKAASYITELESYVASLEKKAGDLEEELEKAASQGHVTPEPARQELPAGLNKLASVGAFTNSDLAELQAMSPHILTKIASAVEEPRAMGGPVGRPKPTVDPLVAWLSS